MKRWLANIIVLASLAVFLFTGVLWVKHLWRRDNVSHVVGIVGRANSSTPDFPRFMLQTYDDIYAYTTVHPSPPNRSPHGYYDAPPEYVQWAADGRARDRELRGYGFFYGYRAMIWAPFYEEGGPPVEARAMAEYRGHMTMIVVPHWFVCAVTVVLPIRWVLRRWQRVRRRRVGRCPSAATTCARRPGGARSAARRWRTRRQPKRSKPFRSSPAMDAVEHENRNRRPPQNFLSRPAKYSTLPPFPSLCYDITA
jgi:hypothetical protein